MRSAKNCPPFEHIVFASNDDEHAIKAILSHYANYLSKASLRLFYDGNVTQAHDYIKRSRIFKFLWMGEPLEDHQKEQLFMMFPILGELYVAIQEFRQIFNERSLPFLYLFVDKFKHSELKPIVSFANGLENDIEAIENAVTSPFSNGFVEGTISKLKMKKRVMYGRAQINLLASKMMYEPKH